jgi:hypothetical protein
MRRFSFPRSSLAAALACLSLLRAGADTVTLKSGEKLEGKITSDTPTELTIDYKVSAGVSDTRTVPKAEVDKVEKESAEEVTYQRLKTVVPAANGYDAAGYDRIIAALDGFLKQFPQTTHKEEISKNLAAFKEEKDRVEAGEVKIGGKWYGKEEAQQERYQLAGGVLFGQMQELARQRKSTDALNLFDQLEKQYPGAYVFPDAIELAKQLTGGLKPVAERALTQWKQVKADREKQNQLASEPQRSELIAAQKREQESGDAAVDSAEKSRAKWPPLLANNEKALQKIISIAPNELHRLEALPVPKMRESIQLSEKARGELKDDPTAAEADARQATSAWNSNEVAQRLSKRATELALAAKATPVPEATPVPPPTPTPTPAPKASPAAASASPAAPTTSATKPTETKDDEKEPFYTTIPFAIGVIVVLVLVFGGLNFYRRMQAKKDQPVDE